MRIADTSADAYSTYVEFMRTYAAHIPQPHVQPYSFFLNPESLAGCGPTKPCSSELSNLTQTQSQKYVRRQPNSVYDLLILTHKYLMNKFAVNTFRQPEWNGMEGCSGKMAAIIHFWAASCIRTLKH